MKYPEHWKAQGVQIQNNGEVYCRRLPDPFRDTYLGVVRSRHREGAQSPGGMVTNTSWEAVKPSGLTHEFASKTEAVDFLLAEGK